MKLVWTVARFPDGSWCTGGRPDDPDYALCEVFRIEAESRDEAKKKAQRKLGWRGIAYGT